MFIPQSKYKLHADNALPLIPTSNTPKTQNVVNSTKTMASFSFTAAIPKLPSTQPNKIRCKFSPSLEETYNVRVERNVPKTRLESLNVDRWSTWKTGVCRLPWNWHVDQQVYVVKGEVRVVPEGMKDGERFMRFVEGDLVRYPKWFEADLFFNGEYEEKYRFLAYGDD